MHESSRARRLSLWAIVATLASVAAGCATSGEEANESLGQQTQNLGGTLRQKKHAGKLAWSKPTFEPGLPSASVIAITFECVGTKAPYELVQTLKNDTTVVASLKGCQEGDLVTLQKVPVAGGASYQVVSIDDETEATSDIFYPLP
jgi:hypothetical protein